MKEKILVTGGLGFIGSHLADRLCNEGYKVSVVDMKSAKEAPYANPRVKYFQGDIADKNIVMRIFRECRPHRVFHCAAQARIQKGIADPEGTFQANCAGTLNVLLASRDFGAGRVVYSASSSAYGNQKKMPLSETFVPNPLNPYALYKLFGENLCRMFCDFYGLETVSLRYFNVYGPRQPLEDIYSTVVVKFLDQWRRKEPLTIVPPGTQSRDFTYVSDVVEANILAVKSKKVGKGEVVNIGGGSSYSIFDLAKIIGGKNYPTRFIDKRSGEAMRSQADVSTARRLLGWKPKVSLKQGIELMKSSISEVEPH